MPHRAAEAAAAAASHGKELHGRTASSTDLTPKSASASDEKPTEIPESKSRITMQNSYRLESKAPFDRDRVAVVLGQIMEDMMSAAQYEPASSGKLAEQVSAEILATVREMNFDRYRFIVLVTIYEKMFQGISSKCNALWDNARDDCTSYTFSNSSMIAVGVVYGIYYD